MTERVKNYLSTVTPVLADYFVLGYGNEAVKFCQNCFSFLLGARKRPGINSEIQPWSEEKTIGS